MPVPTTIDQLSTTAASNYPSGSDSPATLDDVQRAHASFIAQIRDGVQVTNASAKTTPVDADYLPINDSAASNLIKKVTWANVKATLKTYFDTLYPASGTYALPGANADITSLGALTAGGLPDNSVLTADIANAQVTPAKLSQPFTSGTAVATTSGTSIDFTGLPSWVKRVTVMLRGVSLSGTSSLLVQLGDSGGVEVTGYTSSSILAGSGQGSVGLSSTTGFIVYDGAAAQTIDALITLSLIDTASNTWVAGGSSIVVALNYAGALSGSKPLSAVLDRVRLTTVNGTDTFDGGSINIHYE